MILQLFGHFSYIDTNKLKFVFVEPQSAHKLIEHCSGRSPFDRQEFTVLLPAHIKEIPDDIKNKIGLDCNIHVRLRKYKFTSKAKKNLGEVISGTILILCDINTI